MDTGHRHAQYPRRENRGGQVGFKFDPLSLALGPGFADGGKFFKGAFDPLGISNLLMPPPSPPSIGPANPNAADPFAAAAAKSVGGQADPNDNQSPQGNKQQLGG